MESKGRLPPPHLRRPLPGQGLVHPEPFGPGIRRPPGPFPPVDMLPPEVMEQKLASQHMEMQRLATENQRLAATHGTLRQELAAAQHELQILHAQIGAVKAEREQQMRSLKEKIGKMEADLQSADHVKVELQQAREDAKSLVAVRQELIAKAQQLTKDLQRAHADVQQIPAMMSEFESLRQEYHQCRVTFDYEKKLYDDHLQHLQLMEKNYMTMAMEVEKLRAELSNSAKTDGRAGPHGGAAGNNGGEGPGHNAAAAVPNAHEDSYGVGQGRAPLPPVAASSGGANAASVAPQYAGAQPGPPPARPIYDPERVPPYDPYRGNPGFDGQRVGGYDPHRVGSYDGYTTPGYVAQGGPGYDPSRGHGYDPQQRGQIPPVNNSIPYAPPPLPRAGSGNPSRK